VVTVPVNNGGVVEVNLFLSKGFGGESMSKTYLENEKVKIPQEDRISEIKLTCNSCPRQCEMTLLMEGLSVLMVKDDGCKKGTKFAYKEMKNRKKTELKKVVYCCEMDRIEEAV
jgi:hypothetical protein